MRKTWGVAVLLPVALVAGCAGVGGSDDGGGGNGGNSGGSERYVLDGIATSAKQG